QLQQPAPFPHPSGHLPRRRPIVSRGPRPHRALGGVSPVVRHAIPSFRQGDTRIRFFAPPRIPPASPFGTPACTRVWHFPPSFGRRGKPAVEHIHRPSSGARTTGPGVRFPGAVCSGGHKACTACPRARGVRRRARKIILSTLVYQRRMTMPRDVVQLDNVTPQVPLSPAVRAGDFIFVSGQVSMDLETWTFIDGTIEEQTRRTLENIEKILAAAGASRQDIVKVNAYLADMSLFPRFNEAYKEFWPDTYPARTTVGALLSRVLVEIEAVAYVGPRTGQS